MKAIRVYILEDNHQTKERLIDLVGDRLELNLIGHASSGQEALERLRLNRCDLLLLDIHLPDMSGIDILERLRPIPHVIFITAYDQYALRAFDLGAVDYLLKPFSRERFNKSIDRFLEIWRLNRKALSSVKELGFSIKDRGERYLFAYDDIRFISSKGKHTILHTVYRDFEVAKLMKRINETLPDDIFLRVHKQFIVNKNYISRLEHLYSGHYQLHLKGEEIEYLPVGRSFASELKEFIKDINK